MEGDNQDGRELTPAEADTLRTLAGGPGALQRDLGAALKLDKSTVSRALRRLEQRGWLRRVPDDGDQRLRRVELTDEGQAATPSRRTSRPTARVVRVNRDQRKAATRQKILRAARAVFLRRGFHGAVLEDVAEQAGFSKGAVYSTFTSKADLFMALMEDRIDQRVEDLRRTFQENSDHWMRRVDRQDQRWSALMIEFWAFAAQDEGLRHAFAALHNRLLEAVGESVAIEARRRNLKLPVPPKEAARMLVALTNGLALEQALDSNLGLEHLFELTLVALVNGLQ